MTKEGKLKEAIQAKIGSVADTSDMEKELSVNLANLNQAETIKTRLENRWIPWMLQILIMKEK